jgi:capsular exopolysaccharide synthesis family protein
MTRAEGRVLMLGRSTEDRRRPAPSGPSQVSRDEADGLRVPRRLAEAAISEQIVSLVAPESFAADQYRTLRHTVERLRLDAGVQVLAVTSPSPGDGKSVTTLNLAGALAQSPDARVLVIDADLRRPSVSAYLGLGGTRTLGLADALKGECELADAIRHLEQFNLAVLPAGAPQLSPYELLNSSRFDDLIKDARRDYTFVIVDTPPSVPLPDCRLIERSLDGLLIVVAAHKTPRKQLAETLACLDPAKIVGVVFNGDDRPLTGYYGYYGAPHGGAGWWTRVRETLTGRSRP